jgi:hypothetical protein
MPLVMFGVKEQSNRRWLVVQRVRRSSPRSADAPLAGGLSSQCKITNYAVDFLEHNMLNRQQRNDYTAIAPTSLHWTEDMTYGLGAVGQGHAPYLGRTFF